MKPRKAKPLNKPRFVTDINVGFDILRKTYGRFATFTPIIKLTKLQDASDDEIIAICNKMNYNIITHNTKDFESAPVRFPWLKIGIVCVNLKEEHYVDKFGSLLRDFRRHDNFLKKLVTIGNKIVILNYSSLRKINHYK